MNISNTPINAAYKGSCEVFRRRTIVKNRRVYDATLGQQRQLMFGLVWQAEPRMDLSSSAHIAQTFGPLNGDKLASHSISAAMPRVTAGKSRW